MVWKHTRNEKFYVLELLWRGKRTERKCHMYQKIDWLVVLRINVDLAIFQPYLDLEAGDNQSLKIQMARPGIEPRSSCSASQELNHSATTAPLYQKNQACSCQYNQVNDRI